ncbi:MAG: TetR/AcrR family transcriptional regulator [Ilumatobacter sp.]|uniref:TetR/AcrR family transcriptional regulator n=1 Tax=Ilumatobacter sp. TaxID=1967498 RepID=UPI00260687F6|nr:TetR/AcrR family transcriptional regulator [Ilumatobacter sp.]MDJ0769805.1 TetR/AcrR family transcriptional regulator [Ilumatobacter sp.]
MARPLSETARAKMLLATQEIVMLHGLDGFTIDEVSRRSGVAKSTLYRHFRTGDELLLVAVDDLIEEVDAPDTGSLRDDLREMLNTFMAVAGNPKIRQLFVSILKRSITDPEFAATFRNVKEQRHAPLRVVLQRAMARGEVDPSIDVDLAMHMVEGPFVSKRMFADEDVTSRDADVLVELVVRALAPR